MTSTSSVVRPRCTSTLSITTWKNSGLTSANSCRNSETTSTSPNSRRYLTRLGMNQLKSNLASSPARLARLATRISSPVQRSAKARQRLDDGPAALDRFGRVLEQHALAIALGQDDDALASPEPSATNASAGKGDESQSVRRSTATAWLSGPARWPRAGDRRRAGHVAGRPAELVGEMGRDRPRRDAAARSGKVRASDGPSR